MDNLDIMSDRYDEEYQRLMNMLDTKYDEIDSVNEEIQNKRKAT